MLDIMNKLTQLSEAVKDTGKGKIHTAEPGGYGRKEDEDDEGKKVKAAAPAEKKGRGRPKKSDSASGEDKKYDTSSLSDVFGGGKKPKKEIGKVSKKHSLKEYFDQLDAALNEAALLPTQTMVPGVQAGGKTAQPTVIDVKNNPALKAALDKAAQQKQITTVGGQQPGATGAQPTATSPGAMGAANQPAMAEGGIGDMARKVGGVAKKVGGAGLDKLGHGSDEDLIRGMQKNAGMPQTGKKPMATQNKDVEENYVPPNVYRDNEEEYEQEYNLYQTPGVDPKIGAKAFNRAQNVGNRLSNTLRNKEVAAKAKANQSLGQRVKSAVGLGEALSPTHDSDQGAALGAGRSMSTLEGRDEGKPGKTFAKIAKSAGERYGSKEAGERVAGAVRAKLAKQGKLEEDAKPDFTDVDDDKNKKESWKKAEQDKKKAKTKVKEGMDSRLKAAHHAGKSHALSKQGYNCHYDDMEEARQYHDGFKQGLDECYGQMPMEGMSPEVEDMASYGAHTPTIADEGNAFTGALAKTPTGGKFSVGGKTFTDRSAIEEANPFSMSESMTAWDKELNALLEGDTKVTEGMSVSISKGNEGAPDSVSVSAQDADADQLLSLLKSAGMGLFGGDEQVRPGASGPMSVAIDGEPESAEIGVVDDHDGMMDLIKKVTGAQPAPSQAGFGDEEGSEEQVNGEEQGSEDYADEEGNDQSDSGEEETDESTCNECGMMEASCGCPNEGQEQVDEVESEDQMAYEVAEDEEESEESGASQDDEEDDEEETVEESYANSDDDKYQADMDFMTNVISGGLNKQKSTGQSTVPVVATQASRLGNPMQESTNLLHDWKSLAGIK